MRQRPKYQSVATNQTTDQYHDVLQEIKYRSSSEHRDTAILLIHRSTVLRQAHIQTTQARTPDSVDRSPID